MKVASCRQIDLWFIMALKRKRERTTLNNVGQWKLTFKSLFDGVEWTQTFSDDDAGHKLSRATAKSENAEIIGWKYFEY